MSASPVREGLGPELTQLVQQLDPIGWSPDAPSPQCRKELLPPSRVREHTGLDQLGLIWKWARLKVMAKLNYGGMHTITEADNLSQARIAYMHMASWIAEECGHEPIGDADHVQLFEEITKWEVERCIPSAQAAIEASRAQRSLVVGGQYEPGLTAWFFNYESKVIPLGQHFSALRSAFEVHYRQDRGEECLHARASARKDLGSDSQNADAWLETLGGAADLGYFKDGKFLLSSWDIRKKLRALFGTDCELKQRKSAVIVPLRDDGQDLTVLPDETLIEIRDILEITSFQDLADLDFEAIARKWRARGENPADLAARIHLLTQGNRTKVGKLFGVTEQAVRRAEKRIGRRD